MPVATNDLLCAWGPLTPSLAEEINSCTIGVLANRKPRRRIFAIRRQRGSGEGAWRETYRCGIFRPYVNTENDHGAWPEGLVRLAVFLKTL